MEVLGNFFSQLWVQLASFIIFATASRLRGRVACRADAFSPAKSGQTARHHYFSAGNDSASPRASWRMPSEKRSAKSLFRRKRFCRSFSRKIFCAKKFKASLVSYTNEIISQNYPSLVEALPANIREPVLDAISSLQLKIAEHIENVLQSEETIETISGFVGRRVDEVLSQRVSEAVDEETFLKIIEFSRNADSLGRQRTCFRTENPRFYQSPRR